MNRGALSDPSFIGSAKRPRWKKGNHKKRKGAQQKDLWKKRQPKKTQRGSSKRPLMKKEATLRNMKGVIKKTSNKKEAILRKKVKRS
jgi:hypothetical protein